MHINVHRQLGLLLYGSHHNDAGQEAGALSHEEKLREWSLFSLQNRQLCGKIAVAPQHRFRKGLGRWSWALYGGRRKDDKSKLERFVMDIRQSFFTRRTVRYWSISIMIDIQGSIEP